MKKGVVSKSGTKTMNRGLPKRAGSNLYEHTTGLKLQYIASVAVKQRVDTEIYSIQLAASGGNKKGKGGRG